MREHFGSVRGARTISFFLPSSSFLFCFSAPLLPQTPPRRPHSPSSIPAHNSPQAGLSTHLRAPWILPYPWRRAGPGRLCTFWTSSFLFSPLLPRHAALGQGSNPTLPSGPIQGVPGRRLVIGGDPLAAGRAPACAGDASAAARDSTGQARPPRGQAGGCVYPSLPPCGDAWTPRAPPGPCPWGSSTLAGPPGLVTTRTAGRGVHPTSPSTRRRVGPLPSKARGWESTSFSLNLKPPWALS